MTPATIYPIFPGAYCVPSALQALTGADYESVIMPALNRAARNPTLTGAVGPARLSASYIALRELGYLTRPYRNAASSGPLRARLATWGTRSLRYPGRALLVATNTHALVLAAGRVYDTFTPHGAPASEHPFARIIVTSAVLVEKVR